MNVTLKDLARSCGVSVGTVSRALNGKNEVSQRTAQRIRQQALEMGYIPNLAGQALSAQKNISFIGVLLPSINNPFFDDIKRGLEAAARETRDLGLDIVLEEAEGWDPGVHLEALERLKERNCRAFALCTLDDPRIRTQIDEFAARGLPVLLINNDIAASQRLCYVGPDYYKSGQIAAAMLDKCLPGRQLRILAVVGDRYHQGHRSRLEGFQDELKERHCVYELTEVVEGHDRDIDTQQAAMDAFTKHPEINCVYMATGSGVSGLGAAIIADRAHHRFVLACDEIYTTRELVKNDIVDFVICQDPVAQGYQAVRRLQEYLSRKQGGSIDNYIVDNIIKLKNHFQT